MQGIALVDGKRAAEAIVMCQLVPKPGSAGAGQENGAAE
jgi:hypothetical protein